VVDAIGSRRYVLLVAGVLEGFTAPLVCERVAVREVVLVSAMIPVAGETPRDWWHARALEAREDAATVPSVWLCSSSMVSTRRFRAEGEQIQRFEADIALSQNVTSGRGLQSTLASSLAIPTASFRSACSPASLVTGSASRPT
jgi:hypothetical protein